MQPKKAIIIGGGPAGLTAAYELLKRTNVKPIVLEKSDMIGGISRTIDYKGNRMDMGPHRFFSKSDRVMDWWLNIMPLQDGLAKDTEISYQNKSRNLAGEPAATAGQDKVMLVIQRLTRIYFLRKFFTYPIQLSLATLRTLGLIRTIKMICSFLYIRLFPIKPEKNLEDFIINKFGRTLYLLFFKDYTQKVWGIPPSDISAEWGAQRIKGVSLSKALSEALKKFVKQGKKDITQKDTETSLIEQFLYPKYGPGSLWEEVARQIEVMGGKIYLHQDVQKIYMEGNKVSSVNTVNSQTGQAGTWEGDYFFSTMPVRELIADMGQDVPQDVQRIAAGLQYRDFINVGILLRRLSTQKGETLQLKDNWIYIQEKDVQVGRLMIYNNWGDGMIKDPNTTWIGMEYFCNTSDAIWQLSDDEIQRLAITELVNMDLAQPSDVLDATVRRMEKTYPAYFGTYNEFDKIKDFTDSFENLFLIGRNGMHKYNNADHSMLCAMMAVDNIEAGIQSKKNLWAINTEQEYHEAKAAEETVSKARQDLGHYQTFKEFLGKKRKIAFLGMLVLSLEFCVFKLLYPYADFYHSDSQSYLSAALDNSMVAMWPIGYSKFIRLITTFTANDTLIVLFQYLFLQASLFYLFLTITYYFNTSRKIYHAYIIFILVNPLILYLANTLASDSLFASLSIFWFATCLHVLFRPTPTIMVLNSLLMVAAFTVRYQALYYPIIALLIYVFSNQQWYKKIIGYTFGFMLISLFIIGTKQTYKRAKLPEQFSAFGGWQLANNTLYMYSHIYKNTEPIKESKYKEMDQLVRHFYDTTFKPGIYPKKDIGIFYLWDSSAPLKINMMNLAKKEKDSTMKPWYKAGEFYQGYATTLIKRHPLAYLRYFVFENFKKYAYPDLEFLSIYNSGSDSIQPFIKNWFNYKTAKIAPTFPKLNKKLLGLYPFLFALVNFYGLFIFALYIYKHRSEYNNPFFKFVCLLTITWLLNLSFSIAASPVVLRYELFSWIVTYFGICWTMPALLQEDISKPTLRFTNYQNLRVG